MQQRIDPLFVRLDTLDEILFETGHAIAQDADTVQQIPDKDGLEDVELELAAQAGHGHGGVVTHDLRANHGQSLALRRIDLARHDGRAGLVLGQLQFAQAAAGPGAQEADVLRDFEERAGDGVQGARGLDDGVVRGEGFEFVGRGRELCAGHFADFGGDGFVEAFEGVEAGSDCGASLREEAEVRQGGLDALNAVGELGDVAGEFLAEG